MTKKPPSHKKKRIMGRSISSREVTKKGIMYGSMTVFISIIGIFGYKSGIPINGITPFGILNNHFAKGKYSPRLGYVLGLIYAVYKRLVTGGGNDIPSFSYCFNKRDSQSMHFINEDYETPLKPNFNIDELNIDTKGLVHSEAQDITFVGEKHGTFNYYGSLHPERGGDIVIQLRTMLEVVRV
jgi:hypothetical protein